MDAALARRVAPAKPQAEHRTPPPLRVPRMLLRQLSRPLHTTQDVDVLVAQIRLAEWRGLL